MLKPYDGYKETNILWLEEVPSHWECKRINTIFFENKEINLKLDNINAFQFKYGELVAKKKYEINEELAKTYSKYTLIQPQDIMINGLNLNYDFLTQRVALVKENGIITSAYISLRPREKTNSNYYTFLLKSIDSRKIFNGMGSGIRLTLDFSELKKLNVPIPLREEQDQIVKYLDWQTSKINTFIKAKKKQIELLKEQKQAVINKAVTKGLDDMATMKDSGVEWLGEVPEHWSTCRLKQVVNLINDKTAENTLKYIGMENIESWTGNYIQTEIIQPEGVSNKYYKDCILFGKLRPYLAKVFITKDNGICSGELLVLKTISANIVFLKYILLSPIFIDIVNSSTYGAKMPRANWSFIGNVEIPSPPIDEQRAIVTRLEEKTALIDNAITVIENEIELVSEYKTSLISSVVTGKVDVRDVLVPDFEVVEDEVSDIEEGLEADVHDSN